LETLRSVARKSARKIDSTGSACGIEHNPTLISDAPRRTYMVP
jgi:hypothetical protein